MSDKATVDEIVVAAQRFNNLVTEKKALGVYEWAVHHFRDKPASGPRQVLQEMQFDNVVGILYGIERGIDNLPSETASDIAFVVAGMIPSATDQDEFVGAIHTFGLCCRAEIARRLGYYADWHISHGEITVEDTNPDALIAVAEQFASMATKMEAEEGDLKAAAEVRKSAKSLIDHACREGYGNL